MNVATMTKRKLLKSMLKVFDARGSVVIGALPSRVSDTDHSVDKVLHARGNMLRNKADGPAHCVDTEMLQCLPTETVYEVSCWFDKRFKGECHEKLFVSCS